MEDRKSTDYTTVIPADLYDQIMLESLAEGNAALREASQRVKILVIHHES